MLTACKNPAGTLPEEFFKVSFEADGGEPEPEAQLVLKGSLIAEPEAMTRSGLGLVTWTVFNSRQCGIRRYQRFLREALKHSLKKIGFHIAAQNLVQAF